MSVHVCGCVEMYHHHCTSTKAPRNWHLLFWCQVLLHVLMELPKPCDSPWHQRQLARTTSTTLPQGYQGQNIDCCCCCRKASGHRKVHQHTHNAQQGVEVKRHCDAEPGGGATVDGLQHNNSSSTCSPASDQLSQRQVTPEKIDMPTLHLQQETAA